MLQEVSRSVQGLRVEGASDMDIESGTRLVSLVVLDQNRSQSILQLDALVLALVALRRDDLSVCLHCTVFVCVILVCVGLFLF